MPRKSLVIGYVSVFTALAVVGRLGFTVLPNVAPVAPLSMVAGYLGGPIAGFAVGAMSMIISDVFIGMGPWTLFTSFFMGVVGLFGWLIRRLRCDGYLGFFIAYLAVLLYDVGTSVGTVILFGVDPLISILNLFVPIFFLGIPYPMGPVHEFSSSLMFVFLVESLRRFGFVEVYSYGWEGL